jgi:hypothetical protein
MPTEFEEVLDEASEFVDVGIQCIEEWLESQTPGDPTVEAERKNRCLKLLKEMSEYIIIRCEELDV